MSIVGDLLEVAKPKKDLSKVGRTAKPGDIAKRIKATIKDPAQRITVNDLLRVANKRKSLLPTVMGEKRKARITAVEGKPDKNSLTVRGISKGTETYKLSVTFFGVSFSEKRNKLHNHKLPKSKNKEKFVEGISRESHPARVRCSCFAGDTLIPLLEGVSKPIKDLVEEKEFFVYSFDINKNKYVIGKAFNCRKTGEKQKIVKVTFDNGNSIRCTSDHRFLLKNGSYREVQNITVNDSLQPLYRGLSVKLDNSRKQLEGYELIKIDEKNTIYTHKLADEYNKENDAKFFTCKHYVRHHINFNKLDNRPSNIRRMDNKEHWKYHSTCEGLRERMSLNNPMHNEDTKKRIIQTNIKKGHYIKASKRMLVNNPMKDKNTSLKVTKILKDRGHYIGAGYNFRSTDLDVRKKVSVSRKKGIKEGRIKVQGKDFFKASTNGKKALSLFSWLSSLTQDTINITKEIIDKLNYSSLTIFVRSIERCIKREGLSNIKLSRVSQGNWIISKTSKDFNHKIVSIEEVGYEDVYCFEVEKYHNFAIDVDDGKPQSSGVIVHNCEDFNWSFSFWDAKALALSGRTLPKVQNYPWQRVPPERKRNPKKLPSFCKHVVEFVNVLQRRGIFK